MFTRFIHIIMCGCSFLFSMHSIVCIYHNLLLKHSTVDEYLDSSQLGFITNNATINIPINIFK